MIIKNSKEPTKNKTEKNTSLKIVKSQKRYKNKEKVDKTNYKINS